MSLEAKALCFGYRRRGYRQILNEIDLKILPGERVGLMGASGRGKTTLCKLLAGYERPDGGEVLLDGSPLWNYPGKCPVQMIWQHPETAVDPRMRLGDTLAEGGGAEEEIMQALHIQPMWLERYPAELSGGELQRFCIARALGPEVKYLLCDEITAMLDLIAQAQIWQFLLGQAQRRNLGLLIVSHNSALLERLCTRIERL